MTEKGEILLYQHGSLLDAFEVRIQINKIKIKPKTKKTKKKKTKKTNKQKQREYNSAFFIDVLFICLFVCLFVCSVYSSDWKKFQSINDLAFSTP